jgi:hypothetical protein
MGAMTLTQFLDYLASFTQTRELAFAMTEVVDGRRMKSLRRSA